MTVDVETCRACRKPIPEYVDATPEYPEPPLCPECIESIDKHHEWAEREHELEQQHGGLTRCPSCDKFTVRHKSVCTLGYPGHPGAEFSDYAECTNSDCNYAEI